MFVKNFAQKPLLLNVNATLAEALQWSKIHYLYYVPILNHDFLSGYLNIQTIEQNLPQETPVSELLEYQSCPLFVYSNEHIYDALLKLQFQDCLVSLNAVGEYTGIISIHQIPEIFKHLQLQNLGSDTLVLSVHHRDYSLSEISRIAESCNSKIISLFLSQHPDENKWYVNIKFNRKDLSELVSAYERFGYEVAYINLNQLSLSNAHSNYETLMKFLEI